jgi:hypothetical protein
MWGFFKLQPKESAVIQIIDSAMPSNYGVGLALVGLTLGRPPQSQSQPYHTDYRDRDRKNSEPARKAETKPHHVPVRVCKLSSRIEA